MMRSLFNFNAVNTLSMVGFLHVPFLTCPPISTSSDCVMS